MKVLLHIHNIVFPAFFILVCLVFPVYGDGLDETLLLLDGVSGESVTASRAPKPLSQSAENITIVTAAEIDALHAHTLIDVLATIPGVQLESIRSPGSLTYLRLQGSSFNHVLVLLDGIPLNNLSDNYPDIGLVPARIIERIEIVKGAASSSWGQALGGVINVITKSSDEAERSVGGNIATTFGERGTRDTGAEIGGAFTRFGYYLSGGYLTSDGLLANNQSHLSNGYAKLSYDLPTRGQVVATVFNSWGNRGDFDFSGIKEDSSPRITFGTLTVRQPLSERLDMEIGGHYGEKKFDLAFATIQGTSEVNSDESTRGFSSKLIWRGTNNLLAAGMEFDEVRLKATASISAVDILNRKADRWGFYLNDTISLADVAISPGLRYDLTGSGNEQFSPSLGVTWQVSDNNLLRAYTARGYSLPPLLTDRNTEKVWTSQIGVESGSIPNLWLKGTLFRNETWDVFVRNPEPHLERQIKRGGEIELRTIPWHSLSFNGGYTYLDARRSGDHTTVKDIPSQTVNIGLRHDYRDFLLSLLTGRYTWWNANADPSNKGQYSATIWDLHLTATPFGRKTDSPEIFLSIRNMFNGSQYLGDIFRNAGRWVDMGVRFRF